MPSIVVINDDGNILFQNIVDNVEGLMNAIREDGAIPGFNSRPPEVRINGFVVLVEQSTPPRKELPPLSLKQMQVLHLLANALTPEQTALKLGISESTVRMHISALKKKFKTESRDQMMAMAGSLGLCDPFGDAENGESEGLS